MVEAEVNNEARDVKVLKMAAVDAGVIMHLRNLESRMDQGIGYAAEKNSSSAKPVTGLPLKSLPSVTRPR